MFPVEDSVKRQLYLMIGNRLAKHGDVFSKGSSFFTKASQVMDQFDRYIIDVKRRAPKVECTQREFKPVLH